MTYTTDINSDDDDDRANSEASLEIEKEGAVDFLAADS